MNEVKCVKRETKFSDVRVGDCFTIWDTLYIRTQQLTDAYSNITNAINLTNGIWARFSDDDCIDDVFTDATITIS